MLATWQVERTKPVQAVKDATATGKNPGDALANFISQQIHFMTVEYVNYHPTPEEATEIDALVETAKLALEQTQNTPLGNPTQSEMQLIQTGNLTQSEEERIETDNQSQLEAKLTKTGELTKWRLDFLKTVWGRKKQ